MPPWLPQAATWYALVCADGGASATAVGVAADVEPPLLTRAISLSTAMPTARTHNATPPSRRPTRRPEPAVRDVGTTQLGPLPSRRVAETTMAAAIAATPPT